MLKGIVRRLTFWLNFRSFKKMALETDKRFPISWSERYPCLNDVIGTFSFDRHYVYHCAWAARGLAKTKPGLHIDIGSHVYFNALISAFIPIKFYEYRAVDLNLSNLEIGKADLLALPFEDASIRSLSCMHVVEHIGLGRYGEPFDPKGDLKAMAELQRVLAKEGDLFFVVPVGKPKVIFNAHRIYSYDMILDYFKDLRLVSFSLIPDSAEEGGIIENATKGLADKQVYGCGCFWFKK
jgi:hypothetical protein